MCVQTECEQILETVRMHTLWSFAIIQAVQPEAKTHLCKMKVFQTHRQAQLSSTDTHSQSFLASIQCKIVQLVHWLFGGKSKQTAQTVQWANLHL